MAALDIAFSRELLRVTLDEVREKFPAIKARAAWVYNCGRDHWEFHGPDKFYWHGRAANAYDARAKGWNSYLSHKRQETLGPSMIIFD